MTSPVFSTISRGSSGLPVAWAGHTAVQRPHIVQLSVSSSCFQVNSSTVEAPKVSSSVSMRFGIGRMAPLGGRGRLRYMFIGEVNMCRSIVAGSITRNAKKQPTWASHQIWCQPARSPVPSITSWPSGYPTKLHFSKLGPAVEGDAVRLGHEAGHGQHQEGAEDDGVLGLGLDADPVGPLHVAADDRPHHADEQGEAGGVADGRVGPVDVAVEELPAPRATWWLISRIVVTAKRTRNEK